MRNLSKLGLLVCLTSLSGCPLNDGNNDAVDALDIFPPVIEAQFNPRPNAAGWNNSPVTISFACRDFGVGVSSCPGPETVSQETAGTTVTVSATDLNGNQTTQAFTVRIDLTPPYVERSWPPVDGFQTDLESVNVIGDLVDPMSGVLDASISGIDGTRPLTGASFDVVENLNLQFAQASGQFYTIITIAVTDIAGNRSAQQLTLEHVEGGHVLPDSVENAVLSNGVITSTSRAIVGFAPGIDRATSEAILNAGGGRSVGFLPSTNMLVAEFDSVDVSDLSLRLDRLRADLAVLSALPGRYSSLLAPDDNLSLPDGTDNSPGESDAYESVLMGQARARLKSRVELEDLPLSPGSIALIDSGLDPSTGASEFAGDVQHQQVDLCDPSLGLPPEDQDGHGTSVAGVLSAANNGTGVNGAVAGLQGGQFRVLHIRVVCQQDFLDLNQNGDFTEWLADETLILSAIDRILTGDFGVVDIVNASFASVACHPLPGNTIRECTVADDTLGQNYSDFIASQEGSNILFVAGAGNDGFSNLTCAADDIVLWPSRLACDLPNVVSVGGLEGRRFPVGHPDEGKIKLFSNSSVNNGSATTVKAPSRDVFTTSTSAISGYFFEGGTSLAAPFVSGAAALVLAIDPTVTPGVFKKWIAETAVRVQTFRTGSNVGTTDGLNMRDVVFAAEGSSFGWNSSGQSSAVVDVHSVDRAGLAGFEVVLCEGNSGGRTCGSGVDDTLQTFGFMSVSDNQMQVDFDTARGGDYFWAIDRRALPPGTEFRTFTQDTSGLPLGIMVYQQPADRVPVLAGFRFSGMPSREVGSIIVDLISIPGGLSQVSASYFPGNASNDGISVTVDIALVPSSAIGPSQEAFSSVSWGGGAFVDIDEARPVLQGFRLNFENGTHDIREIGIRATPGMIRMKFRDGSASNALPRFHWWVKWADLQF